MPKASAKESAKMAKAVHELIHTKFQPQRIIKNNTTIDITPFPLQIYQENEQIPIPSFSQALAAQIPKPQINPELEKLKIIIQKQEQNLIELKQQIQDAQKAGERIYERYQFIADILYQIQEARKTLSWKEIKAKLKNNKIVKQINEKEQTITIEI